MHNTFVNLQQAAWLQQVGLNQVQEAHWQLSVPELVEHAIRNQEGVLSAEGALACRTGKFTGRSPKDKFIVKDQETQDHVWWGAINNPMSPQHFDQLYKKSNCLFTWKTSLYSRRLRQRFASL